MKVRIDCSGYRCLTRRDSSAACLMQKPCEHIRRLPDAAPVTQLEIGKELLTLACKFNTVDLNPEDGVVELGVCLVRMSSLCVFLPLPGRSQQRHTNWYAYP